MKKTNSQNGVIHIARLNKVIFFWPFILALFALFLIYYFPAFRLPSFILFTIGCAWIFMTAATYLFSSLTIKPKRIILCMGIMVRQTIDIPLDKIESIDIRQSIMGSIFKYGELVITGTGGTRHLIAYINCPLKCRQHVEQLMQNNPVN